MATVSNSLSAAAELVQMAKRVKEVLPQVPIETIQKDLAVTTDIDETITRFLDGTLSFTPEVVRVEETKNGDAHDAKTTNSESPSTNSIDDLPSINTRAQTFARTASDRMKSYRERKQALIENCRIRYMRKHNLQTD